MKFLLFSVFCLICIALIPLFLSWDQHDSVTLAELASLDEKNSLPAQSGFTLREGPAVDNVSLPGPDVASLFYAVLGVCGVVIAIRAVISILRILKEERLRAARRYYELSAVSRPERASIESAAMHRRFSTARKSGLTARDAEERLISRARSVRLFAPSRVLVYLSRCIHGVTGRMVFTFTAIVAAFGLLTITLVYFTLTYSLGKHVIERARVTAVNVSDGAPGFLLKNNATGLREVLRKHVGRTELAYILVENRAGEIFAHSFPMLPQEVQSRSSLGGRPAGSRRVFQIGASVVDEVSVPILEGRAGAVRVGIWRQHVDAEINETVKPLIKLLAFVLGAGILFAAFLAWRINRPIFRLAAAAKAISIGDLDMPAPRVEDASEFGELARAIERMRSSVRAAMIRLSR